jgi:hypothetical protein
MILDLERVLRHGEKGANKGGVSLQFDVLEAFSLIGTGGQRGGGRVGGFLLRCSSAWSANRSRSRQQHWLAGFLI